MLDRWRPDSLRVLRARLPARCADAVEIDEQRSAFFIATLRLAQNTLTVEGKAIPLSPGMNLSAEVKTGSRR